MHSMPARISFMLVLDKFITKEISQFFSHTSSGAPGKKACNSGRPPCTLVGDSAGLADIFNKTDVHGGPGSREAAPRSNQEALPPEQRGLLLQTAQRELCMICAQIRAGVCIASFRTMISQLIRIFLQKNVARYVGYKKAAVSDRCVDTNTSFRILIISAVLAALLRKGCCKSSLAVARFAGSTTRQRPRKLWKSSLHFSGLSSDGGRMTAEVNMARTAESELGGRLLASSMIETAIDQMSTGNECGFLKIISGGIQNGDPHISTFGPAERSTARPKSTVTRTSARTIEREMGSSERVLSLISPLTLSITFAAFRSLQNNRSERERDTRSS